LSQVGVYTLERHLACSKDMNPEFYSLIDRQLPGVWNMTEALQMSHAS